MKWLAWVTVLASWAGVSISLLSRGRVLRWIAEDLTHAGLVLVGPLLLLAIVELYHREKEDDELNLKGVTAEIDGFKVEVLPFYEHSEDVLAIHARLKLRNNAPVMVSPQVSSARIERKCGRSWETLPAMLGSGCPPYTQDRFRVSSHEVQRGDFRFHTCWIGGASSRVGEQLRLVVELDIPGQKNALAKHDFIHRGSHPDKLSASSRSYRPRSGAREPP
jgi:hypothetical protein